MAPPFHDHYGRQMRLPGHGEIGQQRLRDAKVLLVGVGGLGSPAALYLAAAGVGTLGIADPDTVELSNLHRQILHTTDTLGAPKTVSAAETLAPLNPALHITLHPEGIQPENALEVIKRYDIVVDGADNFATRYLVADACVLAGKPLVHGSVLMGEGQVGVFLPKSGCYRCLYPVMPDPSTVPTCAEAGVLGATCGVIGSWMAAETIAIILKQRVASKVIIIDVAGGASKSLGLSADVRCPACGSAPTICGIEPDRYTHSCSPKTMSDAPLEISVEDAQRLLAQKAPPVLVDVREADELAICQIAGALHIPLSQIPERWSDFSVHAAVMVICHHGGRSMRATQFLRSKGLAGVSNIKGGIDAWALKIDPKLARY
jgi:adenylyltransferase/sulfurtransferase